MCLNIKNRFHKIGKSLRERNCTSFQHSCKNGISYVVADAEDLDSIDLHMI